jgi:FkbM family methyltransferase
MRPELFYNPLALLERLGQAATELRRLRKLRHTPASVLEKGHIDSLELLELLSPDPPRVIYDIGANVGTWTLLAKAIFPEAAVHAFEPLTSHLEKFRAATAQLSQVTPHQVCLGSSPGEASLRVLDFSDASSLLPLSSEGKKQWGLAETKRETVRVETLDRWVASQKISAPDLLKLDVQGFEVEVFKGATNCLSQARAVIAEASFREFYEGQCLFHDVVRLMAENDFWLAAIGHGVILGRPLVQCDGLFLRGKPAAK